MTAPLAELLRAAGWTAGADGMPERPAWHARAACRGVGAEPFFPEPGHPHKTYLAHEQAKAAYCATCPVVAQCRSAGAHEPEGIWGAQSPAERNPRRKAA